MKTFPVVIQPPNRPQAEVEVGRVSEVADEDQVMRMIGNAFGEGFDDRDVLEVKRLGGRRPRWSAVYAYDFEVRPRVGIVPKGERVARGDPQELLDAGNVAEARRLLKRALELLGEDG